VYFSVITGYFIMEQIKPILETTGEALSAPQVFTDNPEF
jgi:hypothetical protein